MDLIPRRRDPPLHPAGQTGHGQIDARCVAELKTIVIKSNSDDQIAPAVANRRHFDVAEIAEIRFQDRLERPGRIGDKVRDRLGRRDSRRAVDLDRDVAQRADQLIDAGVDREFLNRLGPLQYLQRQHRIVVDHRRVVVQRSRRADRRRPGWIGQHRIVRTGQHPAV